MNSPDEKRPAPGPKSTTPDDHTLEDLAALTGLFNPEVAWHELERLDAMEEADPTPEPPASE